jgi:hypothetical protein
LINEYIDIHDLGRILNGRIQVGFGEKPERFSPFL